ncbi:MAG: UDP-D-galactose:(glucosyl)lipopolysaccharide-1,6-D-galactosyltransferase [Methanobacterium sp. PtaB.Bin024]|nr:MAG: UDP-D-galactose:(glucosyl)lipopolysaccharide-1,6-D-galactosyltransferase [Methanobacterium sp. PtaB.Bin024]
MKICQLIYTYPPHTIGGADIYAHTISKELSSKGHEVVVITTQPYEGLASLKPSCTMEEGIKVHRFYPLNIYSWTNSAEQSLLRKMIWSGLDIWNLHTYLTIKKILKEENPDVVHIHTPIWISLSAFDAIKSLEIPSIFTVHEFLLLCRKASLLHANGEVCNDPRSICKLYQKASRRIISNKPDVVLSPSNFVFEVLKKNKFLTESKCIKLPLGITPCENKPEKDYKTIDIIYTGALTEHKGVDVLIKAFKNLKNENVRLHIIGKGEKMEDLKLLANNDERIAFHGFLDGNKLTSLQERANIAVMPSIVFENSPMTIYESFKFGTPVIGSRIGGIPELIEERVNGFLYEPGNVSELKNLLQYLIENPEELKKLENGAFKSSQKYSMNFHIETLEKLYKEISDKKI